MSDFGVVILAAGNGTRFGSRKQFLKRNETQLWQEVRRKAKKLTDDIVVVGVDISGGGTRQQSVRAGIGCIKSDRVVILESARPLVTEELIEKIAVFDYPSVGYAIGSTDTIYDGLRRSYIRREETLRLQVPQAFDRELLIKAHDSMSPKAKSDATDDTILMKNNLGIEPRFLEGSPLLYKVTFPEDLKILDIIEETHEI